MTTHNLAATMQSTISPDCVPYAGAGRILPLAEVELATCKRREELMRMVQAGAFPPPVNLGAGAIGWQDTAVSQWLARQG